MEALPKTLIKFIRCFIKKQKYRFIALQFLSLAWTLDNTLWPYVFKLLIDKINAYTGDKAQFWHFMLPVLIIWAGLWLSLALMFRLQGFIMAKIFQQFEADIRMSMFAYVEKHSYDYFANHFAGNISNKISDMTQSASHLLMMIITLFVPAFIALLMACAMFYFIHSGFALIMLLWSTIHIGISFWGGKKCSRLADIHSKSRSRLTGKIVDNFTNIINVKLFARYNFEYQYLLKYQQDEQRKHYVSQIVIEKVKICLDVAAFLLPGVLMTWLIVYGWQHNFLTMGSVVLIFNMTWNVLTLAWIAGLELPNFFKEIGVCQQALALIKAKHDIVDKFDAKSLTINQGEVRFVNINFNYPKGNKVFENLNITMAAGSKIGLVGFSGSGKSTLVNLIMRFFDVKSGQILIDGMDIRDVKVSSLREQIAMIPQDPSLFHRSLMENIRYGNVAASDEAVLAASLHAHCHEFISQLPREYETLVGERGIKLSGGQRQRIAIARAILKNAPILILDEATSALDSITEKYIRDGLDYLMQGRTTIVIAHRLSTLKEMDRIIVLDHGRIIEDGKHAELLEQSGHYAKMWAMQAGGFLPEEISD